MKNNWERKKIGDIGKVKTCKRIYKKETSSFGEIPFLKISSFDDISSCDCFISKELFDKYRSLYSYPNIGDVLISASGTIGKLKRHLSDNVYYQDSNIIWLDNNEKEILNDYLYYIYKNISWVKTLGSTIPRLYNSNVEEVTIEFPKSLKEQEKNIKILKLIDEKIKINMNISSKLEEIIETIYNYWFLQFDFPNEDGKPYKSSGGEMVYNEKLKIEIPKGWKVDKLSNYITFKRGISYTSKNISDNMEDVPMVNLASVNRDATYNKGGIKYFKGKHKEEKIATSNDLLIACTDLTKNLDIVGKPVIVPALYDKFLYSMDLAKVEFKNDLIGRFYLYRTLNTSFYHKYIKGFSSGTNVQHLDLCGIEGYRVVIPNKEVLDKFELLCENLYKKINLSACENEKLEELKNYLLPLLMNGQVGFKEDSE